MVNSEHVRVKLASIIDWESINASAEKVLCILIDLLHHMIFQGWKNNDIRCAAEVSTA